MIASVRSLEKMTNRKLRRWGVFPIVRGGQVFLCENQDIFLPLGDFFAILKLDSEIRIASKTGPIMDVLGTRKKRWDDHAERYNKYFSKAKKDKEYDKDQAAGAFEEVLRDMDKIQVQVR